MKNLLLITILLVTFLGCNKRTDSPNPTALSNAGTIKYPYTDTFVGIIADTEGFGTDATQAFDTSFSTSICVVHDKWILNEVNTITLGFLYPDVECNAIQYPYVSLNNFFQVANHGLGSADSGKNDYNYDGNIFIMKGDTLEYLRHMHLTELGGCGGDQGIIYTRFVGIKKK